MWISEQYRKPLYVTSDVTIGDGKTVILFRGTGTSMTTGETEEIHRDCVLDFEMHAEVLRSEEEPELTVSDWNPEEEGQQNQAETIYDPEAGVTVTLRDISNIGASIVIRREDEDAGTEVTYGDAYILQRRIEGEWQDAETIIDDYGFTMIGHTVGCGEEVSNFYKWDLVLRSIGAGRVPDGVRCLPENRGRGECSGIPGVHPFSTLKESDFLLDRWVGRM